MMPQTIGKQMGNEDKIYADASQPATLIDDNIFIDYATLGDAAVSYTHLTLPTTPYV